MYDPKPESGASVMSRAGDRLRIALCVAVYLLLCVATALVWEPAHDEGMTWHQAIGHIDLLPAPTEPTPISQLYAVIDGDTSHSAGDVIESLMRGGGMHPPAYYLGLHGWSRWVGTRRLALAAPALILGVLSLLGIRRLARELVPGERAGDWAMLLAALSPWLVGYTVLARPYSLALCLSIGSSVAVLAMVGASRRRRAWQAAFVLLSLLGLYTLYHYAFVLVWHLCVLCLYALRSQTGRRRELLEIALMAALIAVGFAPWVPRLLIHLQLTGAQEFYFSGFAPLDRWPALGWRLLLLFGLGESNSVVGAERLQLAFSGLALCTAVGWVRGLGSPGEGGSGRDYRLVWYSLPLLPALIACADWVRDAHTLFISKTSFALFPFLILIALRGWMQLESRWLRTIGLSAWVLLLTVAAVSNLYARKTTEMPFEQVAEYLRQTDRESHLVALSSTYPGYSFPLLLCLRQAGVERVEVVLAPHYRLEAFVDSAAESPEVERLTLLNLDVDYQPVETWQPDLLRRIRMQAREAGFRPRIVDPPTAAAAPQSPGRPLWIVTPIQVKYFSM